MTGRFEGLNPEQAAAVTHRAGPLLILAGAGSGKTRVLTHRIAWLLEQGVDPWQILAVTFTNKAAGEMRQRVAELVGAERAGKVVLGTFHAACVRFLRRDAEVVGYPQSFTIYDDDDQRRLIRAICREQGLPPKKWPAARFQAKIDRAKNQLISPAEYAATMGDGPDDPTVRVYQAYERALRNAGAADFNDLLGLVVRMWREHPAVLERYRDRFRYLLVDEYQDTNRAQYELVRLLAARDRNVTVVGDDDQSIYSFRGADIRNILDFQRDFPDATVVRLERNYRSTANILKAAHAVVRHNRGRMDKELWTDVGDGEPIRLLVGDDADEEAELVVSEIRRLVRAGRRPGEIAVIYRTNRASRAFENALARARLPFVLVGARRFFERREVRDVVAYLRLILNPADNAACARVIDVPARGIGPKTVEELRALAARRGEPLLEAARVYGEGAGRRRGAVRSFVALIDRLAEAARTASPSALVGLVVEESGYADALRAEDTDDARERLENLAELARAVEAEIGSSSGATGDRGLVADLGGRSGGETWAEERDPLRDFLDRASLASDSDELPDAGEEGRVTLLTAHLAKGLEFPVVFVAGMYEGGFPHFRAQLEHEIEEERRLVYVALTRAREQLYLSRPRRHLSLDGGGWRQVTPSRFLRDIPAELMRGAGGRSPPAPVADLAARRRRLGFGPAVRSPLGGASAKRGPVEGPAPPHPTGSVRTTVPEDLSVFEPGTRVWHPRFGEGVVRRREGSPTNPKLHIHFASCGRMAILARFAELEIVID